MKKTVSVNIKGMNFLIEEDAYELLQDYIDRLKKKLTGEQGGQEIIEDIEIRIAELCSARLSESKAVIELHDIQEITSTLGDPEDYVQTEEESDTQEEQAREAHKGQEKRLFRDTENATIAGVCSGIANFLHIDVVIVRAIFVVLGLFAGFGFPLYIILWIIVPKAKNTIDRLRMKGRPITVETVREEVENAAENISKGGKRFAHAVRNEDHYAKSISRGARFLSTLLGLGFILFGLSLLVPFLIFLIGGFDFIPVQSDEGLISFTELGSLILTNDGDYVLFKLGVLLGGFSVVLFLFLIGAKLILRINNKWSKLSLFGLFITGLTGFILCTVIGMRTGKDFVVEGEVEKLLGSVETSQLYIIPHTRTSLTEDGLQVTSHDNFGLVEYDEEEITLYGIDIKYVPSTDSSFHIYQQMSARGLSHKVALTRAEEIDHQTTLQMDTLHIDTYFRFPIDDKLRNQEVKIIVEIPHGGSVHLKDRIIRLGAEDEPEHDNRSLNEEGYLKSDGRYKHDD